jgi:CBS-domain-containing membrane protein
MANSRAFEDDTVPLRIRTRRTLAADGNTSIARSVPCRRRAGDVTIDTCLACTHGQALITTPDGMSLLYCHDAERAAADVTGLPARVPPQDGAGSRSRADQTRVSGIMSTDVICVRAGVDVAALTELLLEHGISGAPVVDASGVPLGVVSKTDLVAAPDTGLTVCDIMTCLTFALPENASIAQAAALMAYERIHRVPITGPDGSVIGIVSTLDVLRWMATEQGYILGD